VTPYQTDQARLYGLKLTARQLQILQLIANGRTTAQIATELFLTTDSVKTHVRRALAKLGARDRAHAVALALCSGLLRRQDVRPSQAPQQAA
jgi:DNA-binding CsgD family transcriptional regulator